MARWPADLRVREFPGEAGLAEAASDHGRRQAAPHAPRRDPARQVLPAHLSEHGSMINGHIIGDRCRHRYLARRSMTASRRAGQATAPGACRMPLGPLLACAAREAAEAAAGSRSNLRMDYRRSRDRSTRTRRCSRLQRGRPRCGPAGGARMPSCRGRADRQAGTSYRLQAPCAATDHGDCAGAARGRRPDRHQVRYRSRCHGYQDCSLNSPPGR